MTLYKAMVWDIRSFTLFINHAHGNADGNN